jgi:hypothetical protein
VTCICLYSFRLVDPVIFTIDSVVEQVHTGFWGGGGPEGRTPLGRHRRGWEDNIKMDFLEGDRGHGLNRSDPG